MDKKSNTIFTILSIILFLALIAGGVMLNESIKRTQQQKQENKISTSKPLHQDLEVPWIVLEYPVGETVRSVNVRAGTSSWTYYKSNGDASTREADGAERNAVYDWDYIKRLPTIERKSGVKEFRLLFSTKPNSYLIGTVKILSSGTSVKSSDISQGVNITGDKIGMAQGDGYGYIYQIHATWDQGDAYYTFLVVNE